MKEIRNLLNSLNHLLDSDITAPLRWKFERAYAQGQILLCPPPVGTVDGPYRLGAVMWNNRPYGLFGLQEHDLSQHIGIFGRSGSGKTNLSKIIVRQIIDNGLPLVVFDWKQTYRVFIDSYPIKLFTPGYVDFPFHFNPLELHTIPSFFREAYIRHLLSVLLNVYFQELRLLSVEGTEYLLMRGINYLKNERASFTFRDLYYWMSNYKPVSRERDWKSSALNVLYKLSSGPIGDVLNHDACNTVEDMVQNQSIIELHWLGSPKDKTFLMQVLLLHLYYHFSRQWPTTKVQFAIVIEEAHNVLLRHQNGYETVIEMILRMIREYGVSVTVIDQSPSLLSPVALANLFCTVAFNLRTYEDLKIMGATLALGEDQDYLTRLRTGEAIVKISDRHLKPFAVKIPLACINCDVAASSNHPSLECAAPVESSHDPIRDFSVSERVPLEFGRIEQIFTSDKLHGKSENPSKSLLIDIYENPLTSTVDRYKRLELGTKKGNQVKDLLVDQQLIRPVAITVKRSRVQLFDITELGKQHLREFGINPYRPGRRGSLTHQFWIAKIKTHYEQLGYRVDEEFTVGGGKAIDLVVTSAKERSAIEIETGLSNVQANLTKCIEAGFMNIKVVAVSRVAKQSIEKCKGIHDKRIEIVTASQLLEINPL